MKIELNELASRMEEIEQDEDRLEQEKEKTENRGKKLQLAMLKLETDVQIAEQLKKNQEAAQEDVRKLEARTENLRAKWKIMQEELLQMLEQDRASMQVLSELEELGEDVSESKTILKERNIIMGECRRQLNALAERLGVNNTDSGSADLKQIDFEHTMNTPSELKILEEMRASDGREDEVLENDIKEPKERKPRLPSGKHGRLLTREGRLEYIPDDPEVQRLLQAYGRGSVEYKDNYPDFSPFIMHEFPDSIKINCQVKIGYMGVYRENPGWEIGRRNTKDSYNLSAELGNYRQADVALCDLILKQNPELAREWNTEEQIQIGRLDLCRRITKYRQINHLTWHECEDGVTMQLIPAKIHDACAHNGGVAWQRFVFDCIDFDDIQGELYEK